MNERIRGDIFGGLSAAVVALPLALAFGAASFAPMGAEWAAQGAVAGMYGAIFTGIFAALFGGTPSQVTGPTGPMTVVLTATVASLVEAGEPPQRILVLTFMVVLLGGLCQVGLGLLRLGALIKFIPYTVIAGFMNGIAVIIFLGQIAPGLGITPPSGESWHAHIDQLRIDMLSVTAVTVAAVYASRKWLPKVPAALVGLLAGTACYQGFAVADDALATMAGNSFIIGEIPRSIPMPTMAGDLLTILLALDMSVIEVLAPNAFVLGFLGAIDSLLTSLVADVATRSRHDSNRELIGQGIGNVISSLFGGTSGAGATVRTLVNVNAGGRGRLSGVTHGLVLLVVLVVLGPIAGWIPKATLAGVLIVTAIGMFDRNSIGLLNKRTARFDVAVVLLVTVITVAVDLMVAVGIGFGVAGVLFLYEMSRATLIRRRSRGNHRHSKHVRTPAQEAVLEAHGGEILIYQLKGNLFFGTTDRLANDLEGERDSATWVILDLREVEHIDITGAELMKRIADETTDAGKHLYLSSLEFADERAEQDLKAYLEELGVIDSVGAEHVYPSLDRALEAAEDALLQREGVHEDRLTRQDAVRSSALFEELGAEEWALVEPHVERRTFSAGEVVFGRGEPSRFVAVVEFGRADIYAGSADEPGPRLAVLGAGLHFGEMALLDEDARSGTVKAQTELGVCILPDDDFRALWNEHPAVAIKIVHGLAKRLSGRLRVTNDQLMEHW